MAETITSYINNMVPSFLAGARFEHANQQMMNMGSSRKSHRKEREREREEREGERETERQTERNSGRSTAFFTVHGVSIFNCMRLEQHVLRTKVQCLSVMREASSNNRPRMFF